MALPSKDALSLAWKIGLGVATAGGAGWKFVESRYVHRDAYEFRTRLDSIEHLRDDSVNAAWRQEIRQQNSETNIRLQQLVCGRRVQEGCR